MVLLLLVVVYLACLLGAVVSAETEGIVRFACCFLLFSALRNDFLSRRRSGTSWGNSTKYKCDFKE